MIHPNLINYSRISIISLLLFISQLLMAQQEMPESVKGKVSSGISLLENSVYPDQVEKALAAFSEAATIAPDYPDVHYYLGKTLAMTQGNAGKAMTELNKYLELYPDAPDADKVREEIAQLKIAVDSKRKYTLLGAEFIETGDGIYVRYIYPFSPANKQLKVGDKITVIGKNKIKAKTSLQTFLGLIGDYPEDSIKGTIVRGGETYSVLFNKASKNMDENIRELGEEDLQSIIQSSAKPVIALFWTAWCGPCIKFALFLREQAKIYGQDVAFISVSLDENFSIGKENGITAFPAIHFYKNGKLFGKIVGSKDTLLIKEKIRTIGENNQPFGLDTPAPGPISQPGASSPPAEKFQYLDIKFPKNLGLADMGFGWFPQPEGVKIIMAFPGFLAEKQGIKKNDIILKVNETSVENVTQDEFRAIMENNRSATFHIKRPVE